MILEYIGYFIAVFFNLEEKTGMFQIYFLGSEAKLKNSVLIKQFECCYPKWADMSGKMYGKTKFL